MFRLQISKRNRIEERPQRIIDIELRVHHNLREATEEFGGLGQRIDILDLELAQNRILDRCVLAKEIGECGRHHEWRVDRVYLWMSGEGSEGPMASAGEV